MHQVSSWAGISTLRLCVAPRSCFRHAMLRAHAICARLCESPLCYSCYLQYRHAIISSHPHQLVVAAGPPTPRAGVSKPVTVAGTRPSRAVGLISSREAGPPWGHQQPSERQFRFRWRRGGSQACRRCLRASSRCFQRGPLAHAPARQRPRRRLRLSAQSGCRRHWPSGLCRQLLHARQR